MNLDLFGFPSAQAPKRPGPKPKWPGGSKRERDKQRQLATRMLRAAMEGRDYRPRRGLTKEQIRENNILAKRAARDASNDAAGRAVRWRYLAGDHRAHVLALKQWQGQLTKPHDAHVKCWRKHNAAALLAKKLKDKYASDPSFAIYHRVKRWMHKHLGNRLPSRKWSNYLGYTPADLAGHLERQFLPGMGWHNRGEWHIDHIVPVCQFDVKEIGDAEFMACYSLANLRPLWGRDNSRKGGKRVTLL